MRQPRCRRREQSGFTMVELLITLVVTVFGLMGSDGAARVARAR